jgi:hypothetical protein
MDLAQILRTAGKLEEARHTAEEALGSYERKGNRPSATSTQAFIAELVPPGQH